MLLPPLATAATTREVAAFYARVAEAAGLPLMAYNNPEASGDDLPRRADRAHRRRGRRGRRRQGVLGRRRAASRRCMHARRTSRSSSAATTGRSRASAPARPAGSRASPTSRPRECVELYEHCRAGELDRARAIYRRLLPLARFDMTPKLVQYFKAAMDAVGLAGGPVRPPRLPLDRRRARRRSTPRSPCCGARGRRVRAARYFAAVDSHTEGMPTRVDHRRRRPDPGRDDARAQAALRARAGRPAAAADARAARARRDVGRDPAAADARRTPTGACCSSRSPAACRCAGTGRSASRPCSSRPAWSR